MDVKDLIMELKCDKLAYNIGHIHLNQPKRHRRGEEVVYVEYRVKMTQIG